MALAAADNSKSAQPATSSASPGWSAADIAQHIDALDRTSSAQAGAEEVMRILIAIMHQPNPATRINLFNRLRPHILAPYAASTRHDASVRVKASAEQPPSP